MIINLSRIDFGGVATGGGDAKPEEVFDVQPTTADQTITPREGYTFSGGTVRAVTSAIDVNIASNNIKEGVSILGVAGTLKGEKPEESFDVQPTTAEQTITPTAGSVFSGGTVHAVTSSIDSNILPQNIKEGVSILGVTGTLSGGGTPDYRYMNGTVDKVGLKAIGWTDEDILTYEQNSPHYTWQNDQYKVSDENKALYLLDDPKPSSYKNNPNITFVPKKNMESYFTKVSAWGGGFIGMKYIKGIPFYDTSNMTGMSRLFDGCFSLITIPQLNTSNVTSMSNMFEDCFQLTSIPQLNTSNVTIMESMFRICSSLTTIPQLDTSKVTNMNSMFRNCSSLTTIPPLNTSNVTVMRWMFEGCSSLATIPQLNTSNVTTMEYMFNDCSNLTSIPQLNTSNVTDMSNMFRFCSNLTSIPLLNTSNVTNMNSMFYNCKKLTSIPQLNTSNVTNMENMFTYCSNLETVEGIDFSGLTSNNPALFGDYSEKPNLTRFIVNGKINVSMSDSDSIKALTAIDYDSVKSILAAADRTDNTNAKTLAFNRTMTDQNGELAALVTSCTSKGWTITGLTLQ